MTATGAENEELADLASARRAVQQALSAADTPRAIALARAAVERGLKEALFHNLIAFGLEDEGRFAEAMSELQRAYELAPRDVVIVNAIGRLLVRQGRLDEALKIYDASLSIEPAYAPTLVNKADALALLKRFDEARGVFRQALGIYPAYADALGGLASVELKRGDVDQARMLAEQALSHEPKHDVAALALAEAVTRDEAPRAEVLLHRLLSRRPTAEMRASAQSLLGDALDAQARYGEAFDAYRAAGATLAALHAPTYARPGAPTMLEMVRWQTERFATADPAAWVGPVQPPLASDPRRHIFFVGFPRSGTTLVEQILASHPDVVALDERQALADATRDLFSSDVKLDRLQTISAEDAQRYRQGYWRDVSAHCPDVSGKVFVDKYPLSSDRLALIAKLFPEASVLFALRDPRDVVLSCFRRRFELNPAMYEFCTLAGAAALYDAVMRLVDVYKAKLTLPVHYVRHERVVADLRGEVGGVCDFIGIDWNDAMLDFAQTARRRSVRTPSAAQVRRGLYDEGLGHWRNYRAELAPVMPLLAPWVEAFGYPAD